MFSFTSSQKGIKDSQQNQSHFSETIEIEGRSETGLVISGEIPNAVVDDLAAVGLIEQPNPVQIQTVYFINEHGSWVPRLRLRLYKSVIDGGNGDACYFEEKSQVDGHKTRLRANLSCVTQVDEAFLQSIEDVFPGSALLKPVVVGSSIRRYWRVDGKEYPRVTVDSNVSYRMFETGQEIFSLGDRKKVEMKIGVHDNPDYYSSIMSAMLANTDLDAVSSDFIVPRVAAGYMSIGINSLANC